MGTEVAARPEDRPALPRVLTDTRRAADGRGAVWRLEDADRDLDANLVALPPGDGIATHEGGVLDVLIHVVAGSGRLETSAGPVDLSLGALVWLPRRSTRGFAAGPQGLRYLTVHRRRPPTLLQPTTRPGPG